MRRRTLDGPGVERERAGGSRLTRTLIAVIHTGLLTAAEVESSAAQPPGQHGYETTPRH